MIPIVSGSSVPTYAFVAWTIVEVWISPLSVLRVQSLAVPVIFVTGVQVWRLSPSFRARRQI